MPNSLLLLSHPPLGQIGHVAAADHGAWELDLWEGSARFNPWFYRKLQWPVSDSRKTLVDLQPHLESGAWEALVLQIRVHLGGSMRDMSAGVG